MSAHMTLPEQIDGLDKLLSLVSTLSKDDIVATQKVAREQLQLTQAEQGKVAEARSYIAKYESLVADLNARESALAQAKSEHLQSVNSFNSHLDSENKRLESFAASLAEREAGLAKKEKIHEEAIQTHAQLKTNQEKEHQNALQELRKKEAENASAAKGNEEERQRLAQLEASLKAKAQKIREQASNF